MNRVHQPVSPERNFWCSVIRIQFAEAMLGEQASIRWFCSHMWETVSSLLFDADEARAIEDKALACPVRRTRTFTPEQLEARRKRNRDWYKNHKKVTV